MPPEFTRLTIEILVFLGGCLFTAWRVGYVVASFMGKIDQQMTSMKQEFNALLDLKGAEADAKIGRVYERFDDYKVHMEDNFIRKEMCTVMHAANATATEEFRKEMLRRLESLECKMDAIIMGKANGRP